MNEEKNQILEITETISRDFDKAGISSLISKGNFNSLTELKKYLSKKLRELLDTDFEKLINILYRIDVNEEKLNELFGNTNKEPIPPKLADLIIERQLQKIHIRNMYRKERKNLPEE